jgi:acetyltransferase-like isoleucine patch superfamily enzyme
MTDTRTERERTLGGGVIVGPGVTIGANTVVAVGNPARIVRSI